MQGHSNVTICEHMWMKWRGEFKGAIQWGESKGEIYLLNMEIQSK